MADSKEAEQTLKDSVRNISFYNAYKFQEHSSRENEINDESQHLKNLNEHEKVNEINERFSKENLDERYSQLDKKEQLDNYKNLYTMQEHYYMYNVANDSSDDSYITQNQLKNLKELNYLEKHVLTDQEKYQSQFEANQNILNQDTLNKKLDETKNEYQQQSQKLFQNSNTDKENFEELQDETKSILANKKVLDNNDDFIKNNKDDLILINQTEEEKLDRKRKEAREVEKLQSKDIMWKIVEEQGKNSQYLTEEGEQTLDARTNADNIQRQISTNNSAQYGQSQISRNTSYTNAYSSLQHSQRVSNANVTQQQEDQYNEKQQEQKDDNIQEKQQKHRGMSL
ncbi:hypothetical protein [Staphylococcus sp. GDY8P11P]|uniref:hypothetical protein n=1 Tax=Staphylococcus sp. GDY8P11P TaxID=2804410 RepID=UPI00194E9D15|nr:hypothetical protein [Staphylococcus sp. GDY8P11P]